MGPETGIVGKWKFDREEFRRLAYEQAAKDPHHAQGAMLERMLEFMMGTELEFAAGGTLRMSLPGMGEQPGTWTFADGVFTLTPAQGPLTLTARLSENRLSVHGPDGPPLPMVRA